MNGLLVINKEKNYTSRDIVNIVSKKLGTKKIGHTGTLDPMAEGVLVLCVNKYTSLVELITNFDKEYVGEITLGIETDTLDITGNVIKSSDASHITKDKIIEALNFYRKSYEQEVPIYSAVKINGKKLYDYARNNEKIDLPKRMVNIKNLDLISDIVYEKDTVKFKIRCLVSKGTYIRSLIRDIGEYLKVGASMSSLVRTSVGPFKIEESFTLADIDTGNFKFMKIKDALPDLEVVTIKDELLKKIKNGSVLEKFFDSDMALLIDNDGNEIAIYQKDKNNKVRPCKML